MFKTRLQKSLWCGALALTGLLAGVQTAQAGPVRVKFTPPFDAPFPDLEWSGQADIFDGSCAQTGSVSNFVAPCAGQFTFQNATLTLSSIATPALSQTISVAGAMVITVQRTGLTPADFQGVVGTPFAPVQFPGVSSADYAGSPAWFSLVMVGGKDVQLYWFKNDPGTYFQSPNTYLACGKPGVNVIDGNVCGQSTNTAQGVFLPVPEPSTYAMMVAGLGALGFIARRRRRKA